MRMSFVSIMFQYNRIRVSVVSYTRAILDYTEITSIILLYSTVVKCSIEKVLSEEKVLSNIIKSL